MQNASQSKNGTGERRFWEPTAQFDTLKVDKTGRFLLVIRPAFCVTEQTRKRIEEEAARAAAQLDEWWKSGDKFGVVVIDPFAQISVERGED